MDLIREIRELVQAVKEARADGRLTPMEALVIAKELADVIQVLYEMLLSDPRVRTALGSLQA